MYRQRARPSKRTSRYQRIDRRTARTAGDNGLVSIGAVSAVITPHSEPLDEVTAFSPECREFLGEDGTVCAHQKSSRKDMVVCSDLSNQRGAKTASGPIPVDRSTKLPTDGERELHDGFGPRCGERNAANPETRPPFRDAPMGQVGERRMTGDGVEPGHDRRIRAQALRR